MMLCAAGIAIAALVPGPQHMICPTCHGIERLASGTFVEASFALRERRQILVDLAAARRKVAGFFGPLKSNPRIIVCKTARCSALFGSQHAKGIAYGWHAVLLNPSRIFDVIAAHELAHIELHWRMGFTGWARGTVPA
ncbi:MAG: hypothetical protein KKB37_05195, partial [Alphaproteobacteria bacterium]|nr:hypothetical protein [Alphaproteobacteria bacterium]